MTRGGSWIRRASVAAALLAAGLVVAGLSAPHWLRLDRYHPILESQLGTLLGRRVALGALTLQLWPGTGARAAGIEIGGATGSGRGSRWVATAAGATVRLAPWPLLRGRLVLRGMDLDGLDVRLGSTSVWSDGDLRVTVESSAEGDLRWRGVLGGRVDLVPGLPDGEARFVCRLVEDRVEVEQLDLSLGRGSITASGRVAGLRTGTLRVDLAGTGGAGESRGRGRVTAALGPASTEIDFDLVAERLVLGETVGLLPAARRSEPHAGAAASRAGRRSTIVTGTVRADRAVLDRLELERVTARIAYADGRLQLDGIEFEACGGRHRGRLGVDLEAGGRPFHVAAELEAIDLACLHRGIGPSDGPDLQGRGRLDARLDGRLEDGRLDPRSIRGSLRAAVADGRVGSVDIAAQIAGRFGRPATPEGAPAGTAFEAASATFEVADGTARTADLAVQSTELELTGSGHIDLDGGLDLDLVGALSPAVSAKLVERASAMRHWVRPDGRLAVPLRLVGDVRAPEVRVDVDRILDAGVRGFLEDKGRRDLVRRLLGGR